MMRVNIADLKAHLSEHLRYVRRGHVLAVLDRDTPVARVVPYQEPEVLRTRRPAGRHRSVRAVPLPPPLATTIDVLDLLRDERQSER